MSCGKSGHFKIHCTVHRHDNSELNATLLTVVSCHLADELRTVLGLS